MGLIRSLFAVLIFGSVFGCLRAGPTPTPISFEDSLRNEKALLKILWPVLKSSGKAARIYYPAVCPAGDIHQVNYLVAFPHIDAQKPSADTTGLAAVREMFRNNQYASVAENRSGIISIRIGDVADEILKTKISVLRLEPLSQYNDQLAIGAIIGNRQVQDAMHNLGVSTPIRPMNMIVTEPAEGRVHLPASMSDLTMDQALDEVALTFKGVVLYGTCTRPNAFEITFSGGVYFDDSWLDR